jgi:isopentenyl-diphosphate delta-isomerase
METRWQTVADLAQDLRRAPGQYTPWLRIYLEQHRQSILPD